MIEQRQLQRLAAKQDHGLGTVGGGQHLVPLVDQKPGQQLAL
jgi:hypothetical protein